MEKPTADVLRTINAWTQAISLALLFSNLVWLPYAHANPSTSRYSGDKFVWTEFGTL